MFREHRIDIMSSRCKDETFQSLATAFKFSETSLRRGFVVRSNHEGSKGERGEVKRRKCR